ncbi:MULTISPECIES: di-heme oxidoredictase family protein [unclassified Rhizobium]|uniref:di-heme oxidoreductase family protein n=1 Tax=unclassified Rhizobium TaxID=2613769 RepID=UPI0009E7CB46|nr:MULTISPECIES: di-heme oxidoredictase family protein [unclassified Rhizobium]
MTARTVPRSITTAAAASLAAGLVVAAVGAWVGAGSGASFSAQAVPAVSAVAPPWSGGNAERSDLSEQDRRRVARVVKPTRDVSRPEPFEAMAGGAGTSTARPDRAVLTHPAANLDSEAEQRFRLGSALFEKLWVSSPSSTQASDGLGPLYNARSCETCHVRDGRGQPPSGEAGSPSLVVKFSFPGQARSGPQGDPVYGRQLQDNAVPGLAAEGRLVPRYQEVPVMLAGGEQVSLRRPVYAIEGLAYGPLARATRLSPRLAPPMTGLGLLEAIDVGDILTHADPQDRDGDGISGRPSWIAEGAADTPVLGRFGWKAQAPTVRAQAAEAFATDIGISTPDVMRSHGDCTALQPQCLSLKDGVQPRLGSSEAPDPVLDLVAFYARHLAVPARRDVAAPAVLTGKRIFSEAGCATCHVPKFVTRRDPATPSVAFQLIWPYSDLLLHDMGEGLSDEKADDAVGQEDALPGEWRTPPLWGIGLARTVDREAGFLHDGRARTLTEAILWHGGEAQAARDRFVSLDVADRRALLAFLESL